MSASLDGLVDTPPETIYIERGKSFTTRNSIIINALGSIVNAVKRVSVPNIYH